MIEIAFFCGWLRSQPFFMRQIKFNIYYELNFIKQDTLIWGRLI